MSLLISKNGASPFSYYSSETELDPIRATAVLDGGGGTVVENTDTTTYLVATNFNYTDITVNFINEESGINWQISTDAVNWGESITPSDMNALSNDQVLQIYIRCVFTNDGSVDTGLFNAPDVQIVAIERPE